MVGPPVVGASPMRRWPMLPKARLVFHGANFEPHKKKTKKHSGRRRRSSRGCIALGTFRQPFLQVKIRRKRQRPVVVREVVFWLLALFVH